MKILVLTRYSRLGASSRLRFYQYLPYLNELGWTITIEPLLEDNYIADLYNNRSRDYRLIFTSYWRRLKVLTTSSRYDILWIEKELFPMLPSWFEELLGIFKIPYVVDFDDAIFHNYDLNPRWLVRLCLGNKIDKVMKKAALVIAGNEYLANRARQAGTKRVEIVPTVIDINKYEPMYERNDVFTVGWIGSPATSKYLDLIKSPLEKFNKCNHYKLVLVGAGSFHANNVTIENRLWSEDTEVRDIQSFDVGIMPLPDDPWERGKCGYKLIQYMACGKPVIASPVGVNNDIVESGINGYLAHDEDEWVEAFRAIHDYPNMALKMGKQNREKIEKSYCIQVVANEIEALLRSIVK